MPTASLVLSPPVNCRNKLASLHMACHSPALHDLERKAECKKGKNSSCQDNKAEWAACEGTCVCYVQYVCVCGCVCVTCVHLQCISVCICVHVYICLWVYVCKCVYISAPVCIHVHVYKCVKKICVYRNPCG